MNARPDRLRALAASIRLPNLPSVWSNTLTGILIGGLAVSSEVNVLLIIKLSCVLTAATCLYLAGNLLNDWADRKWDAEHRPERALPSGLFTPEVYLTLAICLLVIGWTAAGIASFSALYTSLALSAAIGIYTWLHKRTSWSVLPMATCRALLPVMGFSAFTTFQKSAYTTLLGFLCMAVFLYLIMLSLAARSESSPNSKPPAVLLLGFLLPPAPLIFMAVNNWGWSVSLAGMLPYLAWIIVTLTLLRKPVPRLVSSLLAGIPLVDSMILIPAAITSSSYGGIVMWLWLPAFILGRLLQRIVPAT